MSKDQIVSDAKSAFISGQDQILGQVLSDVYDKAASEQKASDGTLTQADLDAAVKAATDPLNQQISDLQAKDDSDIAALKDAQDKLAALQTSFDVLSSKEAGEAIQVSQFQGMKDQLIAAQSSLAALLASISPPTP